MQGKVVKSGGAELAHQLEAQGYDWIKEELRYRRRNCRSKKHKKGGRFKMTVETKLALTEQDVRSFSEKMNEAAWMTDFRADAFAKVEQLPMPKPDKTKIDKWNFTEFPIHAVESAVYASLDELPEEARAVI